MKKITVQEHREGLIELYESQLEKESSEFMIAVLKTTLEMLKASYVHPHSVEKRVVKLEKLYKKDWK